MYQDRIADAKFISPSGKEIKFLYYEVESSISKRTAINNFIDTSGTYVQDFGNNGRLCEMSCYFSGADHDLESAEFERAVLEVGSGTLQHPRYGTFSVRVVGDVRRRNNSAQDVLGTFVDVSFQESIDDIYPEQQKSDKDEIEAELISARAGIAGDFAKVDISTASKRADALNKYKSLKERYLTPIKKIGSQVKEAKDKIEKIDRDINSEIDELIADPITLAFQTVILIQEPIRIIKAARDRLTAYRDLLLDTIGLDFGLTENLFASSAIYGLATSALDAVESGAYRTSDEARIASAELLSFNDEFLAWSQGEESTTAIQALSVKIAGYISRASFDLAKEKRVTLDKQETILNLCAEYYQRVDEKTVEYFIQTNKIEPEEFFILSHGREVVFYL